MTPSLRARSIAFASMMSLALAGTAGAKEVVVYSARTEPLIEPLFQSFEKQTGIKVKFVTDQAPALIEKLKAQGAKPQADLLLTVDAGNLYLADRENLLEPVADEELAKNVPAHLRHPGNKWFGLSIRARTIFFDTRKVKAADLSTYEDLAAPKWKGKLCLRTSGKVYNQSLVAMMIARHGVAKAEDIVRGWVANLAAPVFNSDSQLLEAIAAGQCQVGIANTYYYGRLMAEKPKLPVGIFWPNQKTSGVHVNISGAGLIRGAPHKAEAVRLLAWMSGPEAQKVLADSNMEYPVNPKVSPSPQVAGWGPFKPDELNLSKAGELQPEAVKLMDRAGYR